MLEQGRVEGIKQQNNKITKGTRGKQIKNQKRCRM